MCLIEEVGSEASISSYDSVLQCGEVVCDTDGVLFYHSLLVERVCLLTLEVLVVLLIKFALL